LPAAFTSRRFTAPVREGDVASTLRAAFFRRNRYKARHATEEGHAPASPAAAAAPLGIVRLRPGEMFMSQQTGNKALKQVRHAKIEIPYRSTNVHRVPLACAATRSRERQNGSPESRRRSVCYGTYALKRQGTQEGSPIFCFKTDIE